MTMKVWVLLDETPVPEDEQGIAISLIGVFSSREKALANLYDVEIGHSAMRSLVWTQSPSNPEFYEGRDTEHRYILTMEVIDRGTPH